MTIADSSALTLTSHQLENFLEGAMAKLADQTQSTGSIRAQMNTFGVMKTVVENIDILKQVFADFADIDVESDAPEYDPDDVLDEKRHLYVDPEDMQMSMEAFVSMLSGLGLIGMPIMGYHSFEALIMFSFEFLHQMKEVGRLARTPQRCHRGKKPVYCPFGKPS